MSWERPDNDKWRFRIVDISNMDIVVDEEYTDKELAETLTFKNNTGRNKVKLPSHYELGVEFGIKINRVKDFDRLIERYYNAIVAQEVHYEKEWDLKRTDASSDRYEKGHPDYVLTYHGPEDSGHKENHIYLELKKNGDTLRNGQLEWMLEHCTDGYSVYLINIETPEYTK